jgi:type IV secretion system protein VirD4
MLGEMMLFPAVASTVLAGGTLGIAYLKRRYEAQAHDAKVWATAADLEKWGLLRAPDFDGNWPVPSFVLGAHSHGLLHDYTTRETSRHALISAPTGTGKTWSIFYPTLMHWTHSAIVHARKDEVINFTAGWRSTFSDIVILDPTSMSSACYNPLDNIRWDGIYAIRDAQNVVQHLAASTGGKDGEGNATFVETAKDFATVALIYLVTHAPVPERNFAGFRKALADGPALAEKMQNNQHPHSHVRGEIARSATALYSNPSERFIGGVEGTIRSWLRVYQDTVLAYITSKSDFCPSDLMCGPRPVTLYIRLPPTESDRLAPFVRLFMSQMMDELMAEEGFDREGNPKLWHLGWILDEFWRLGRVDAIHGALADMRSYRHRMLIGVQSLGQIIDLYV